jgi:hypothetical protein
MKANIKTTFTVMISLLLCSGVLSQNIKNSRKKSVHQSFLSSIDSVIENTINLKIDRYDQLINRKIQNSKKTIDSLKNEIEILQIKQKNNDRDFNKYTLVVSILMLFFTLLVSWLLPKQNERYINHKTNSLKEEIKQLKEQNKLTQIKIQDTHVNALRSLYKAAPNGTQGKFIWDIRWVHSLSELYELAPKENLLRDIKSIINRSLKEFDIIPDKTMLKKFENLPGLIENLKDMANNKNDEISNISIELLSLINKI